MEKFSAGIALAVTKKQHMEALSRMYRGKQ